MKPFIVFEGPEGSGKTTQIELLRKHLEREGLKVLITKQPGGDDPLCLELRKVLLRNRNNPVSSRSEFLLFEADRAQHVDFVLMPALEDTSIYDVVICSRYEGSSFAYQSTARRVCNKEEFEFINSFATQGLKPTFTFFLDVDPLVGRKRKHKQKNLDRIESEDVSFYKAVQEGFVQYFKTIENKEWMKIDGNVSEEIVHKIIVEKVTNLVFSSIKPLV